VFLATAIHLLIESSERDRVSGYLFLFTSRFEWKLICVPYRSMTVVINNFDHVGSRQLYVFVRDPRGES